MVVKYYDMNETKYGSIPLVLLFYFMKSLENIVPSDAQQANEKKIIIQHS